jgi:hypothetical protein
MSEHAIKAISLDFQAVLQAREKELLVWALTEAGENRTKAANLLRISYRSFRHYAGKHNLGSKVSFEWAQKHAKEARAGALLRKAITDGIIKKPDKCSGCGKDGGIEGHHADYDKPLEVLWVCTPCHRLEHLKLAQKHRRETIIIAG